MVFRESRSRNEQPALPKTATRSPQDTARGLLAEVYHGGQADANEKLEGGAGAARENAPFGVVTQGLGFSGAVRHSLHVWKSALWGTTGLVTVGSFFYALIGAAMQALILLAVWEFYRANVIAPESSSVPESSPSP